MVYENVRAVYGNICTDRGHLYLATFDSTQQAVQERDKSTGDVQFSWPTDQLFTQVFSAEFDGYYWWTLERQTNGFVVRKWKKSSSIFASLVKTFSYTSSATLSYDVYAMAVEYYSSFITIPIGPSVDTINVDDASKFRLGDEVVIGPSSATGYVGNYDIGNIIAIAGNSVRVSPVLNNRFAANDGVYSTRSFWIVNNSGDSASRGSLIKFGAKLGNLLLVDYDVLYKNVQGATFYQNKVLFTKGNSVVWIDPDSVNIFKIMYIDNLRDDRSTPSVVYDMYGFGDFVYTLQRETAYESGGTWLLDSWSSYNTVERKTVPEVFIISFISEKPVLHAIASPYVTTASSTLFCTVYDQYLTPVLGKTVDFTTNAGTLSPIQAVTDSNGQCSTVYTGDSQVRLVTITAETS